MAYNDQTYLTVDNLSEITAISKNINPEKLEPFIVTAEDQFVVNILGDSLDTELKAELDSYTISGDNKTLVENYIIPASAWITFRESIIFINFSINNKSITKASSDHSENISVEELNIYRQKVMHFRNITDHEWENYETYIHELAS